MLNRRSFMKTAGQLGLGALMPAHPIAASGTREKPQADVLAHGMAHEQEGSMADRSALESLLAIERWEDVRDQTDCREVVQYYLPTGVRLRRLSPRSSSWVAPCPFCQSKWFEVIPELYACGHCHASGSAVDYVAHAESLTWGSAMARLDTMLKTGEIEGRGKEFARFWQIREEATAYYHSLLLEQPEGENTREWVRRQGISPATMRRLRLGYCPSEPSDLLYKHLEQRGYSEGEMDAAGLIGRRTGDGRIVDFHARDVLLIPVTDAQGHVWTFLEESALGYWKPEVCWSSGRQGPLCSHRYERMVYPVPSWPQDFQRHDCLLLTTQPLDVVLLQQEGIANVICPVGAWDWGAPAVFRTAFAMAREFVHVAEDPMDSIRLDKLQATFAPHYDRIRFVHLPTGQSLRHLLRSEGAAGIAKLTATAPSIAQLLGA